MNASKREEMIVNLLLGSIKSTQRKFSIFISVTKFPRLINWLFCKGRPFRIFGQFMELFKKTNDKNWGFLVEKERERKSNMDTKNRGQKERVNFQIFKY